MTECAKCVHTNLTLTDEPCSVCLEFKDGFSLFDPMPEGKEDLEDEQPSLIGRVRRSPDTIYI